MSNQRFAKVRIPLFAQIACFFTAIFTLTACGVQIKNPTFSKAGLHLTASLVSLEITPPTSSIASSSSQNFQATALYADGTTQDVTSSATWSSGNPAVVSIPLLLSGRALGLLPGTSLITASLSGVTANAHLTVTSATLVSISITPPHPSIALGTGDNFTATGTYSDGTTQNLTTSVTWSSSNNAIATISNAAGTQGHSSSVATGAVTITATSGLISGTTPLTITAATLSSIAVTPANPSIALGTGENFTATGTYSDGTTQNLTTSVTWSSSNNAVATISNAAGTQGNATSVATGAVTITAASGLINGTTSLTVTAATLSSIAVTPANPSIALGTAENFTATGTYSDGTTQNLTTSVTWSSSNNAVATISNAAGTQGNATSVATGTVTITAASGLISGTTQLTVNAAGPLTLVSISFTPSTAISVLVGNTKNVIATGTYSDGSTQDITTSVTWSTTTNNCVTVSNAPGSQGQIYGVSQCDDDLTATLGSVSSTMYVDATNSDNYIVVSSAPGSAGKTGPQNARSWMLSVHEEGTGNLTNVQLTTVTVTRRSGTNCTPVVNTATPIVIGTINSDATVYVPVTIDFTGCDNTTVFTVVIDGTSDQLSFGQGGRITGF